MDTTVGQLLINDALPEDLRDYERVLDKQSTQALFTLLAEKHPEKYAEVNRRLHQVAAKVMSVHGNQASVSLASLKAPDSVYKLRGELKQRIAKILDSALPEEERNQSIVEEIYKSIDGIEKETYESSLKADNPFALQLLSGARGSKAQLRSVLAGDLMVIDHKDNPIPIPILNSYSEGLDPVQYWASGYGARKGAVSTKFSTPKAGYLGKQLILASHQLIVTEEDCGTLNSISIPGGDKDNVGAVLSTAAGEYKAGTVITPKMLKQFDGQELRIRSPLTCQAHRGVCQRCAGVRERGGFSPIGDNIGVAAAQAAAEPMGQGALSVKHGGGMAGSASSKTGLDLINQLVQVPEAFADGAATAEVDGRVSSVTPAPQGGSYITVGEQQHWMPAGQKMKVNIGDIVEAGDALSNGLPNPALIVKHKGIGEGRRQFVDQFTNAMRDNGFDTNRRNTELLARGLINQVRVTDLYGPAHSMQDDIIDYDTLISDWKPRAGFKTSAPNAAVGNYLEAPALHYSVGTKITPRVADTLRKASISSITHHEEPPPFIPEMTRAMETLSSNNDWMVQLSGFNLKKNLLKSVHRSRTADTHGISYLPALAQGTEFGKPPAGEVGY
jgi:DNA-directed RNA polymerase subunit beta'